MLKYLTVTLNGTGQSISGSTTFYNLTKSVTSADTLTFAASSTQTIASGGTLTLNGASNQLLSLVSSSPGNSSTLGTQYNITLNGSSAVSYVSVQDANASGGYVIPASYSTDSNDLNGANNNLNWMINSGVINSVKVWKGTTSNAWATATNWQTQSGGATTVPSSSAPYDGVLIGNYTTAPLISAGPVTIASLIMSSGTLTMQYSGSSPNLTVTGNVIMSGTSNLTHTANAGTELYKLNMSVAGNFTLNSGTTINVTGDGYSGNSGTGLSTGSWNGGSYGGIGGFGNNGGVPGAIYGSITAPVNIGSGGNNGSGTGGGAVILNISGVFTNNGTISANGNNITGAGSGSGGSVYITTGTISGTGAISANGATTNGGNGAGGGGRVAIILTSSGATFSNYSVTPTTYGGTGTTAPGAAGTVYEQTQAQTTGAGTLIINNNSVITGTEPGGARITTLMPSAGSVGSGGVAVNLNNFSDIIITGNGNLQLNSDTTINFGTATINNTTGSGSTFTSVTPVSTTANSFITLYGSTSPLVAINTTNVVFTSA